jgi:hypothetical protein
MFSPLRSGQPYSGTDWIGYQIPELGPMRARIARSLPGTPGRVAETEASSRPRPAPPCGRPIPSQWATVSADTRRPGRVMSRGPGRWQRELLVATRGVHTATVSGVVRTCVPEPDRNDFTAARRGAKGLAMVGKVVALYVYACQRCGRVQDHEPEQCCGVVRSSLAVTRPGRALPHLAPPPSGTRCPPWIGLSVASRSPSLPGRLATPSAADLARLVLRRAYERVLDGEAKVTLGDAAALLRLQREIDREAADQAAGTTAQWQATLREVLWTARRHLGEHWEPFVADIRVNQHLTAMWGPPRQSGTAPARFSGLGSATLVVTKGRCSWPMSCGARTPHAGGPSNGAPRGVRPCIAALPAVRPPAVSGSAWPRPSGPAPIPPFLANPVAPRPRKPSPGPAIMLLARRRPSGTRSPTPRPHSSRNS